MGKRVKKKSRAVQKEKHIAVQSPKAVSQSNDESVVSADTIDGAALERRGCVHLNKGFDLNVFSEKIQSSDPSKCGDCGGADRKGGKGKGKHGKKKGSGSVDPKWDSKAIWVCLQCGHFACGGVGLPTIPQSHAVRHSRLTHHPLVVQWENPHLLWCFPCNNLIPLEKSEENGAKNDVLEEVVKVIKTRSSQKTSSADVEDVWLGSGNVANETKLEDSLSKGSYVVRGLVNLGNTCFFNSVMQNVLAMKKLRDYFLNQDSNFGPLCISLKKLFAETEPETSLKGMVVNPKSFFGTLCSKASQFRGYQQQDSHELLRCLLDNLSTEESGAKREGQSPTFVRSAFGGQISSTVSCLECGHSSTVYEPFLDLSLPIPTKKSTTRKTEPLGRAKKTKLPPKRMGKLKTKSNKDMDLFRGQSISNADQSSCSGSSSKMVAAVSLTDNMIASSSETTTSNSTQPVMVADSGDLTSQNHSSIPESEKEQESTVNHSETPVDDLSWLDYLGPDPSDEQSFVSENNLVSEDSSSQKVISCDDKVEDSQISSIAVEPNLNPNCSLVNPWEEEAPLQVQKSEVLLLPYKDIFTKEGINREAEASSSFVGGSQDEVDFDGIGDLFNEPEVSAKTVVGPSLSIDFTEAGFTSGNTSWSDPDELDNTDAPVSVETCLTHFVKPELLSNDNAWECANCNKILLCKRLEAKKKQQAKTLSEAFVKEAENGSHVTKESFCLSELKDHNGDINTDSHHNSMDQDLEPSNCSVQDEASDMEPVAAHKQKNEISVSSSDCPGHDNSGTEEKASVDQPTSTDPATDRDQCSQPDDLELEKEEEEGKFQKVKKDACKRFLIEKAPPILTIHLKRFSQDARGRASKLHGHISFRDVLDLRPFMVSRCPDLDKHLYRLLGVIEHLGSMRGGHYVAYVRGRKKNKSSPEEKETEEESVWYHASDSYIREAIPRRFVKRNGEAVESSPVYLKDPFNNTWKVEVLKGDNDGEVWFGNGWQGFAKHYALDLGYFLTFRYQDNKRFRVLIFDTTATEIDYQFYSSLVTDQAPDPDPNSVGVCTRKGKWKLTTRARTERVGRNAKVAAAEFISKSKYPSTMLLTRVYGKNRFPSPNLDYNFLEEHLGSYFYDFVYLKVADGTWRLLLRTYHNRASTLGKGWAKFARENCLGTRDVCLLEVIKKGEKRVMRVFSEEILVD